ncbi:acetylornithine deacetylase [Sulfitobacter sp. LCG007]
MTGLARTLEILDRLIAFETVSAAPNLGLIDYAEGLLRAAGFDTTRLPDATGTKAGLYAVTGPPGAGVLLSSHTDVVPAAGQEWTRDPFRLTLEDARAYGRGTTDMKGFLACILALAEQAGRTRLREPLKIVLSYDEEVGCIGIRDMLDRLLPMIGRPRACIVGEPTGMQVAVGHKGKVALRATCHGQGGHSALAPRFVNALHLAADFIVKLRGLQEELARDGARDEAYGVPFSTVHVGRLQGGTALNIVPDRAEIDVEFRHLAADAPGEILAALGREADRAAEPFRASFPDARIVLEEISAYPGLDVGPDEQVVAWAGKLARSPTPIKVAFGTEAGYFAALGIPTVVCGPGDMEGQGHKPDEFISLAALADCGAMMDRLLDDLRA